MPIYGSFTLLLIQIFIACLLGNCVELTVCINQIVYVAYTWILINVHFFHQQHSRIYESALYLKWNELEICDQCFYRFFVRRCQTPQLLTIGGFIPLNLNSCVKVYMNYRLCDNFFWT